jgi:hypothetical protein
MSQFLNILKSFPTDSVLPLIQNINPELLSKIGDPSVISNLSSASGPVLEAVSNTIEESAPVLVDSVQAVSKVYRWRNFIVIAIILWAVFVLATRLMNPYPETQEKIEKASELLIGRTGVLQLIVMVWISAILIVTLVPAVLSLTPKLEKLLGVGTAILEGVGLKK